MNQDTQPGDLPKARTLVEWKLPLSWILGVVGVFAAFAIGLIFQIGSQGETLKDMKDQLKDMKIAINAGNNQAMTLAGEIAILRFRVETLETNQKAAR